jgi:hypothetical protein
MYFIFGGIMFYSNATIQKYNPLVIPYANTRFDAFQQLIELL